MSKYPNFGLAVLDQEGVLVCVRSTRSQYGLGTGGVAASAGLAAIRITSLYIPVLTINTCLYSRLPVGTVLSGLPWSTVVLSRCPGGPPALLYVFSDTCELCVSRLSAVLSCYYIGSYLKSALCEARTLRA